MEEKFKRIEELRNKNLVDMTEEEKFLVKEYIDFVIAKQQEEKIATEHYDENNYEVINMVNEHHNMVVDETRKLEEQRAKEAEKARLERGVRFDELPGDMAVGDWFRWLNSVGMHYNKEDYDNFMKYFIDEDEKLKEEYLDGFNPRR